jgi:hypothetical protein
MCERRSTLETKKEGKAPDHGRSDALHRTQREGSVRVFKDVHGTEHLRYSHTILVNHGGHASGDDSVAGRHWVVVCADRLTR